LALLSLGVGVTFPGKSRKSDLVSQRRWLTIKQFRSQCQ
jgi:hypothetical protein